MNIGKWLMVGCFVFGMVFCAPMLPAQDDLGVPGMEAPPPQFIKPADVLKMMQDKDTSFALVDTQPEEAFADGHIPGAINYPWVPQVKPPISLPRNKMLVLYCPCNHDEDSIDMYKKLSEFGFLNTKILEGGWYKWVALKYPVAGTDAANAIKMAEAAAAQGETPGSTDSAAASSSNSTPAPSTESAPANASASSGPITSGRQVGAVTPSFRVMDVTGKYKGQDTCYVCEYGAAPTVIGFFQKPSDQAADLIVKLNDLVKSQKDLKGFAVMIEGPDTKGWLEKLAQDKGIQIPLVYLQRGPQDSGVRVYKLNPAANNTILVNDDRQVVANFVNLTSGDFQQVTDASTKMLAAATTKSGGQ